MADGTPQERATFMKAAAALAFGVSLLFSGAAAAQVYNCKGADGRVVYSDARCGTSEERTDVDVRDNVIETSMDVERVQRQLAQQEREAAAERQRLKAEQKRATKRRASTRKAAKEESAADGTPEPRRRVKARQRRIKSQQRAQQQRVTPYSQR